MVADGPRDSDFALARAAAGGAADALSELYVRHRRRVYSLCMRMVRNAADAEDLTQDVFVHLLGQVGSFRGDSLFTTWLHRLTVNQVLMRFRRDSRRRGLMPDQTSGQSPWVRTSHPTAPPPVVDRLSLEAALSLLPPGYRWAFVLHDIGGYSHQEVADVLGCSIGTSKSQLHKARMKLRRLLNSAKPRRA
ncbi:MAG TPA: RNA polymerase sigma factor [Pyrinomonadaceae bacterium]|nr:RNA polymerase sigma factor [Pyrinomonadaceae bacterium]